MAPMRAVKEPCHEDPPLADLREERVRLQKPDSDSSHSPPSDEDDSNDSSGGAPGPPPSRSSVLTESTSAPATNSPNSSLQASSAAGGCAGDDNLLGLGSDEDDDDIFGDQDDDDDEGTSPSESKLAATSDGDDPARCAAVAGDTSDSESALSSIGTENFGTIVAGSAPASGAVADPGPVRKSPFYTSLGQPARNQQGDLSRSLPSLTQLCLSRIRKLRCRIEGLALLPTEVVAAIVEGSTAEELKQMELVNKGVTSIPIWDSFWEAVGQKSMAPAQLAQKPPDETWREFYARHEKEKKAKLIEAGQRCRDRWNNLQTSRDRTVALDDNNTVGANGFEPIGFAGRRRATGSRATAASSGVSGGASAGAVKAIRKSLRAGFSPSPRFSSTVWQNRVPPSRVPLSAPPSSFSSSSSRSPRAGTMTVSGAPSGTGSVLVSKLQNSPHGSSVMPAAGRAATLSTGTRPGGVAKPAAATGPPRSATAISRSARLAAAPPLGIPAAKMPRVQPGLLTRTPSASSDLAASRNRGGRPLVAKVVSRNDGSS